MSYVFSVSSVSTIWDGKLWWDQWQGGEGAIYSSLNGDTMAYPWEVDNSSRVISTVAIYCQRYSSCSLLDMRIHDINLVADLTAHDPNDPFPADGTIQGIAGSTLGTYASQSATVYEDTLANLIVDWLLDDFWPICSLAISLVIDAIVDILVYIDLIGNIDIQTVDMHLQACENMDDSEVETIAFDFFNLIADSIIYIIIASSLAFGTSLFAFRSISSNLGLLVGAFIAWTIALCVWLAFLEWSFHEGYQSAQECIIAVTGIMFAIAGEGFRNGILATFRFLKYVTFNVPILSVLAVMFEMEFDEIQQACFNRWVFLFFEILAFGILTFYCWKFFNYLFLAYEV